MDLVLDFGLSDGTALESSGNNMLLMRPELQVKETAPTSKVVERALLRKAQHELQMRV